MSVYILLLLVIIYVIYVQRIEIVKAIKICSLLLVFLYFFSSINSKSYINAFNPQFLLFLYIYIDKKNMYFLYSIIQNH